MADNVVKEKLTPEADHHYHVDRSDEENKVLSLRLRKIGGQIRGIERMVNGGTYCPDILTQVSAVSSALNSFTKVLLNSHIKSCVVNDIKNGNENAIDELCEVFGKVMK